MNKIIILIISIFLLSSCFNNSNFIKNNFIKYGAESEKSKGGGNGIPGLEKGTR